MKKSSRKTLKNAFEKDYNAIVKGSHMAGQEWTGKGDAFVKFSLYKFQPTIAKPDTTYQGYLD